MLVVRVAGLPGDCLAAFSSRRCLEPLEAGRRLGESLAAVRSGVVDLLSQVLPSFTPATRRFLLAVRRDAFNGRELSRHAVHSDWPVLERVSQGLAGRLLSLEAETRRLDTELRACHEQERDRERHHLFEHLRNTRFLRGIALSSPDLVEKARELGRHPAGRFDRRGRKVEQSLLRFVTRAAAKLSPYSTLTAFALGTVRDDAGPGNLGVLEANLREISLLRVRRDLLECYLTLLLRHPRLRDCCCLALNDSAEKIEPGRYRFLRPGHWQLDPERRGFQYLPAAQVKVTLTSSLVDPLSRLLAPGPAPYAGVIRELAGEMDLPEDGADLHSRVERLVSVGFLHRLPPWPTYEPRLEESLLSLLSRSSGDDDLGAVRQALETLVDAERRYATEAQPERAARLLAEAFERFAAAVDQATGSDTSGTPRTAQLLHEDVLLVPAVQAGSWDALQIAPHRSAAILQSAELLSKFASLYNHRHDFLHTLAAFWAARWPERREMPFLELFWNAQPLWREYLRFDFEHRFHLFSSYNPSALASVDSLSRLREEVFSGAQALMREGLSGKFLAPENLAALLAEVPARYHPQLGCSVFVQPAEPGGELWVLNRLFEGTGRYLSRYGAVLEEPARSRYAAQFKDRSTLELDGEDVELLDLMFPSLSTSNAHSPQTGRILQAPGEHVGAAADGRVLLSELKVQADLSSESFRILDSRGRRLLPVHLSSLNHFFLPVMLRFLAVFGPYEVRQVFPRPQPVGPGIFDRLTCGPLVVRRRRWELDTASIGTVDAQEAGSEFFRRMHDWRLAAGLPQQVFVFEAIHQSDGEIQSFKPQYLDFTSPSLAGVFLSVLRKAGKSLIFEEALPSFSAFPLDSAGRPRAIEIQMDSLTMRPLRPDVDAGACGWATGSPSHPEGSLETRS
jgi:lantibiotic biosynthesis protein